MDIDDFLIEKGLKIDCIVESDIDVDKYVQYQVKDLIKEALTKQLSMRVVGSSAITDADLIAFAKWLDDMSYTHRLKIVPKDLTEFYLKNKASILEQYS